MSVAESRSVADGEGDAGGAGLRLTALAEDDLEYATQLSAALGWPYRLEDWQFAYALGEGLAIRDKDRLVGTGMIWKYGEAFATVGMIIVDAAWRGKRLGSLLVDGLIEKAASRSVLLNATLDGLELYRRRGFVTVGETRQHQGIAAPSDRRAGMGRVEQAGRAQLTEVLELDRSATGMLRERLLSRLVELGDLFVLRGQTDACTGYAVSRKFGRGHVIGPVVADSFDEAKALIAEPLSRLAGNFVRLDTSAASGLSPWLEAQGLVPVDTVEAMVRGTPPAADLPGRVFALANQSLG
jgi:GNAT superfamily N-acetyltransferase